MDAVRYAYSTFPELLAKLHLTVADVHARLLRRGFKFDKKTLYRLASHKPIQTINAPVVGAVCEEFKIGLNDLLTWERPTPKLHRIDAKTQSRLDQLMTKNTEGKLTTAEKKELATLGETVERLSLENARMLATHAETGRRARAARRTAVSRSRRKAA
jgi:hypothetical protein